MELLAPAGNYQALIAAIEAGADAVYTGGKHFSARKQASNLDEGEMQKAVEYCHLRDRKLYIAVNTLIADTEMEQVLSYIFQLQTIGVDALIIQDVGLMNRCRQVFPDLRLHASTQMSIHNQQGVKWAVDQGISRVVLARELSMHQVQMIHEESPNTELEFFGHGALCYSFSGQCLFSSMVGGRSGNRGNCAQPCRLPYELYNQSQIKSDLTGQHLLSPADLCLLPHLEEMQAVGVCSLKIEGRMKRPEYVATVTGVYRQALDQGQLSETRLQQATQQLTAAFNRNFTSGFWTGVGQEWLSPQRPNNRGILLGRIVEKQDGIVTIALKEELRIGDGIEIWTSIGNNAVTVVRRIWVNGSEVSKAEAGTRVQVDINGVGIGDRVFKTSDANLIAKAQELAVENRQAGRRRVQFWCEARAGQPFRITIQDLITGLEITRDSGEILSVARGNPTTEEVIKEKIGELGDTAFTIAGITITIDGQCLVPYSWIKEVRRQAIDEFRQVLLEQRRPPYISASDFKVKLSLTEELKNRMLARKDAVLLTVAVDRVDAAQEALAAGADRVYLNLAGIKGQPLRTIAVRELMSKCQGKQELLFLLPRIMLPGEKLLDLAEPHGAVITNPGWQSSGYEDKVGDYTLNVFNGKSVAYWLKAGLKTVCLSPELNLQQVKRLAASFPGKLECLVHGDLPLMTSRFCLLGYQSGSASCSGCSRPCVNGNYHLRDRKGYHFPLRTDHYGRFYLYNSRTLCALEESPELISSGIGALRLQLPLNTPEEVNRIVTIYRQVIDEKPAPDEWAEIKAQLHSLAISDFTKLHYYRGVI